MYSIKSTSICLYAIGFIHSHTLPEQNLFFKFVFVAFFVLFYYQILEDLKQDFTSLLCLMIQFPLYLKKIHNLIPLVPFFLSNTDFAIGCQLTFAKLQFGNLKIIIN